MTTVIPCRGASGPLRLTWDILAPQRRAFFEIHVVVTWIRTAISTHASIITVQEHRPGYDVHYKIIRNFSGGQVLHADVPFVGYPANGEHTAIPDNENLLTGRSVVVGAGPGDSGGGGGAGDGVALAGGASFGDDSDMGMVVLSAGVSALSRVTH
ncbi:hypothetical protein DFH09DRAFT_1069444 [Mycena vulgaris]|nr:hypothetical protein DFH09DRAFT_1069444 [Mycena vulgaris]